MINYYGLEILELFKYKNKDNIFKNIMHLVWKEWLYLDEAIIKFIIIEGKI